MHTYGAVILDHLHPIMLFVYLLFELSVNENCTYIFSTISILYYIYTVSKGRVIFNNISFPLILISMLDS